MASRSTLCRARRTAKCTSGTLETSISLSSKPSPRKARCKVGSHSSLSTSHVPKAAILAFHVSSSSRHRRPRPSGQPQTKVSSASSIGAFVQWFRAKTSAPQNTCSESTRVRGTRDPCSLSNAHLSTTTCCSLSTTSTSPSGRSVCSTAKSLSSVQRTRVALRTPVAPLVPPVQALSLSRRITESTSGTSMTSQTSLLFR